MQLLKRPDNSWVISFDDGTIYGEFSNARNMGLHFIELIENTTKKDGLLKEFFETLERHEQLLEQIRDLVDG